MAIRHIIRAQQFDKAYLEHMFPRIQRKERVLRRGGDDRCRGKIMATVFYEPSTRTRLSFESAAGRLRMTVITTENAKSFSSAAKGETLEDSIEVLSGYADVIVLRHFEEGAAQRAAMVSDVPIINAGDGPGQHPTQSLLDSSFIWKRFGSFDGLSVALVGDLANGRTVRSLVYLLAKFPIDTLYFVAPDFVAMRHDIKEYLDKHGVKYVEAPSLADVADRVHVVYMTRLQLERQIVSAYDMAKCLWVVRKGHIGDAEDARKGTFIDDAIVTANQLLVDDSSRLSEVQGILRALQDGDPKLREMSEEFQRWRTDAHKSAYEDIVMDRRILECMRQDAIIMHPLPRVNEIATEVDDDPRAQWIAQAHHGVPTRMALLESVVLDPDIAGHDLPAPIPWEDTLD